MTAKQFIVGLFFLVCVSFFLALASGTMDAPLRDMIGIFFNDNNPLLKQIILELRLPRAVAALAVGGMLSLSGALMQVLLRNPLADPYILGLSGGAACGAILAMIA